MVGGTIVHGVWIIRLNLKSSDITAKRLNTPIPRGQNPDHVGDNWAKPVVNTTGNYKLIFDAHLERAQIGSR
jgi:hypothetical protein